jgi:ABC-2 type transport system permease protein
VLRYSILRKTLRDQRWQIAGFGLSLTAMAAMTVGIWPSYRDMLQNFDIPSAFQAFLGTDLSIATPAGFLSAEFFSWIPILLIVYAVIAGTGAIAGEESNGTLDLVLAQPVTRRSLLLQKAAATAIGSAAIVAIGFLGFAVTIPFVDIAVSLGDTAVACANMLPITLLFFTLSLWLGAVLPNRAAASAGAVGVATAAYFVNSLANGVQSLRNLQYASPFYYYGAGLPLIHGINWWHAGLLLGLSALFVVLALRTFTQRDVSTGGATDLDMAGLLRRIVAHGASS